MRKIIGLFIVCFLSVQTAVADDEIIKFFKDYHWDAGVNGNMGFDGVQTDVWRVTVGAGAHLGYHLNERTGMQVEIMQFFYSHGDADTEDITSTVYAGSLTYDFSPERYYSLYAIGGLGYENLKKFGNDRSNPISLLGFGFRYMFAEAWSARIEGRWRFVLSNISYPDNGLIGSVGVDYHF